MDIKYISKMVESGECPREEVDSLRKMYKVGKKKNEIIIYVHDEKRKIFCLVLFMYCVCNFF